MALDFSRFGTPVQSEKSAPDFSQFGTPVETEEPVPPAAPAVPTDSRQFVPPGQEDPQAQLRRFLADREALKKEISRLPQGDPRIGILQQELAYTQQGADYYRQQVGKPTVAPFAPAPTAPAVPPTGVQFGSEFAKGAERAVKVDLPTLYEQTGVLKDIGALTTVQQRLNLFNQIERGEIKSLDQLRGLDMTTGQGRMYLSGSPEVREKLRQRALDEVSRRKDFVNAAIKTVQQYQEDRKKFAPLVEKAGDIGSVTDFANWLGSNMGSGAVQMAPMILAAATTGGVGLVGISAAMGVGESVGNRLQFIQEQTKDLSPEKRSEAIIKYLQETGDVSLATGIASGLMDAAFGPEAAFVKKAAAEAVKGMTRKEAVKEAAKRVPGQIAAEGLTGAGQQATQIAGQVRLKEKPEFFTVENLKEIAESAAAEAAGAPVGAAIPVAAAALRKPTAEPAAPIAPSERIEPTFEERPVVAPETRVEPTMEGTQPTELQRMFRELEETSGLPTEPEVTPTAPEVAPPAVAETAPVAEAPTAPPAVAEPVAEKPAAPTPPKAPTAESEFEPAPVRPAGFRAPTPLENKNINSQAVLDLGNGARVHFTYDDFFISAPGSTPGQETGVIRLDDTRKGVFYRPELFPDFIPQEMRQPLIDAQRAVYSEKDLGKKQQIIRDVVSEISQFVPKAEEPVAEAPAPEAPSVEEAAPAAEPAALTSPEVTRLQAAYDKAKASLDAIGSEPAKPSSESRYFGSAGREGAAPEVVKAYDEKVKAYNSWRRKYSKLKKAEVDAANELFRAKQATPTEAPTQVTPVQEVPAQAAPASTEGRLPDIVVPAGFKAKKGRKPQLVFAARALAEGKITKDQYDEYVERYNPIKEVLGGEMELPIEDALMTQILTKEIPKKKDPKLVNAPIADGTRVGLRMDIPALDWGRENGVNGSVVSIHEGSDPKNKTEGKNISYKSTGRVTNVVFAPRSEEDAFKIAQQAEPETRTKKTGEIYLKEVADKKPQQTIEGDWVNTSPEETLRLVREHFNDPNWVQVSLDPLRHSYFYARDSKRPVLSADEALQVGRFVLVKNPVYGDRQQFLYNIEPILSRPVTGTPASRLPSFKREVAKLRDQHTRGLMTDEEFARRIDALIYEDSRRKFEKDIRTLREGRVRGGDYIRQRLLEAVRRGDLSGEAVDLAEWFIINNPQLVEDLGVSIRAPREGGVGGMYSALPRVMFLVKEGGSDNTVVHEILHHLERMMPANIQSAIRREWTKQFLKAQKNAKTPTEQLYFNALSTHHFDNRPMSFDTVPTDLRELFFKTLRAMDIEGGSVDGSVLARHLLINSDLDIGNYQYYNPSEFWAVNGSDIVRGRYEAIRGGVLTRLKNWLRELGQKIKAIFGLASDAPIIRALDSLAKSDGQFVTDDLLDQAQTLFSVKPSKKQTDTPEFKRWFGESKVVDENGEPMIMYHGTSKTEGGEAFTKFDTYASEYGLFGQGSYFTDNPEVASSYTKKGRGPAPTVYPVYLSIKNPIDMDAPADAEAWSKAFPDVDFEQEVPKGGTNEQFYRAAEEYIIDQEVPKYEGADMIQEALRSMGHDGVTHIGGGRVQADGVRHRVYIAFDPEQVKSSTGNIGTFDPNDPNILYSIEPEAKPAPREAKPAKTIEPSKIDREREAWTVGRDELGRPNFGPGAKAYDAVARLANIALDKIAMKPISPELSRAMRNMKVHVAKTQKEVGAIGKELSKMSPQERALISDVIEGELQAGINPPQEVLNTAAAMQSLMTKQSQELVRLGMLSKEAANRWENKYLPRFYEKKLGDETKAWAQAAKRLLMKEPTMQGIKGKQLKSRGMYKAVYVEDLPEWIAEGWEQRDPSFNPKTSTETIVWRDYTREEREKMGEIRDAMFRFVMGYNASQRDIALGRLYENLADNYASKSPAEGLVQVPDTKIEGTGANRYGKLAGLYVPKEIMDHLVWNDQEMANGLYKLYRAGLGRWKEGKTVLNPTAHANNVFSNFTMAHFAGVSYWDVHKYAGALRDFVKNNDRLKEAEDIGLFTGTFSQAEMVENMPPELKKLANMTESQIAKYGDKAWDLLSYTLEWDGKKYGVRPAMKWMYENEDFFFRYLIYSDARNRGMEPEDAREYSNQFIFTYDDLPAGARVVRDIGMPFFSYTYKVVPVLTRTALEYPWRFAAPAAAVYTLNAMMYAIAASLGGDDDDWWGKVLYKYATDKEFRNKANKLEEEERKNLPPWMKGKSSLGTEKAIRLGMDDVTGLPLFMDISRIFPGGDLLDAENNAGGVALLQPLTPSNPVFTTLVAMLANKDMFLGKDIVNEKTDDANDQAKKRAAWLWKQWAPAISVGNYHFDRAMNTIANMTGEPVSIKAGPVDVEYTGVGKDGLPVIPKYAVMQTFGVKVRPYDLETSEAINESEKNKAIRALVSEVKRIDRLEERGAITPRVAGIEREKLERKKELLEAGLTIEGKEKK